MNNSQSKPVNKTATVDERIESLLTDRKILLFRYDAHLRREIWQKLTALQRQPLNRISAAGIEAISKKELETLLRDVRKTIQTHYADVSEFSQKELEQLLPIEVNSTTDIYNEAVRFDLFNTAPEITQQAVKSAQIIAGSPLEKWWDKQGNDLAFKFEGLIRQGMLDGKQTSQLITEAKALLATSRRHSETLVRTAVMQVHSHAQEIVRDNNLDILKGEQQISTLDLRTSDVCRVRDGKAWDLDKKPIGDHNLPYARPPLHPNCRSTMRLLTKSWRELGFDIDEIPESTRASMDGQVKQGLTYEDWLKGKTPAEQDTVLGKGKADLWRRGVITFRDMLDQTGRPMTLAQLQDDRLVSWISNARYHQIQKEIAKLPKFAETIEKYGLTQEEGSAIYAYTTNLYNKINPKMRSGKLSKADQGFISVVEQGLAKLPSFEGITHRYTDLSGEDLIKYQVGNTVTELAFTSTSKKDGVHGFKDGYVYFELNGKSGKFIQALSKYPQQYEVLFGEKTPFKVTFSGYDSKMRKYRIRLEEQ